jgi:hypothetical protein
MVAVIAEPVAKRAHTWSAGSEADAAAEFTLPAAADIFAISWADIAPRPFACCARAGNTNNSNNKDKKQSKQKSL